MTEETKVHCPHCKRPIVVQPDISDEWDVVNEAIARNKGFRIDWKQYFGKSLTKTTAKLYSQGKSVQESFEKLSSILAQLGITNPKIYENLKIGVSSRYGEMNSELKELGLK